MLAIDTMRWDRRDGHREEYYPDDAYSSTSKKKTTVVVARKKRDPQTSDAGQHPVVFVLGVADEEVLREPMWGLFWERCTGGEIQRYIPFLLFFRWVWP